MVDGKSLKEDMNEEKERLSRMTWEQKKEHIWEYYKIPIIAVAVLIAAVIGIVYMFRLNDYENVLYTVVTDGGIQGMDKKEDRLTTEFTEYLGIDGKKERVYFDNNYTLTYTNSVDQDPYISAEKIMTQIATGSIDALITDKSNLRGFSTTDEEFNKVSDYVIYYKLSDGTELPVALDLTATKLVKDMGLSVKNPCFAIVRSSTHIDNATAFIRYAFDLD